MTDDDERLVEADALLERGDSRGELITIEVTLGRAGLRTLDDLVMSDHDDTQLAYFAALFRRQAALRDTYEREDSIDLRLTPESLTWPRRDLAKVHTLHLPYRGVTSAQVIDVISQAPAVRELALLPMDRSALDLRALPPLAQLRSLALLDMVLRREHLDVLAAHPLAARLERLRIRGDALGDAALDVLDGRFPRLERIDFQWTGLTPAGFQRALTLPRHVTLGDIPLGGDGASALAPHLANVQSLRLADCGIADPDLRPLVAHARALERLDIEHSEVGDTGARILAEAGLARLVDLRLEHANLTPFGVAAVLAAYPLRALAVTTADTGELARTIATSAPSLRDLTIYDSGLEDEHVHVLATSLAQLRSLRLAHNRITDDGAKTIAAQLTRLVRLWLYGNDLSDDGKAVLAQRDYAELLAETP